MKRELLEILVCPLCKGELQLSIEQDNSEEIVAGALDCPECNERYPIVDTIPNLLPPDLR